MMVSLDIIHDRTKVETHEFCAITTAANYMVTGGHMQFNDVAVIVADGAVYEIRRVL